MGLLHGNKNRLQHYAILTKKAACFTISKDGVVKKINFGKNFMELLSINPMYPPRLFENEEVERISIVGLVKQIIKNV